MHGSCTRSILYRNACGPTLIMRCSLAGDCMFYCVRCVWLCLHRFNVCVVAFMCSLIFRMLCVVYVICLGFVSFWFRCDGLSVFICVGVGFLSHFCSRVVTLYVGRVRYGLVCFVFVYFPLLFTYVRL